MTIKERTVTSLQLFILSLFLFIGIFYAFFTINKDYTNLTFEKVAPYFSSSYESSNDSYKVRGADIEKITEYIKYKKIKQDIENLSQMKESEVSDVILHNIKYDINTELLVEFEQIEEKVDQLVSIDELIEICEEYSDHQEKNSLIRYALLPPSLLLFFIFFLLFILFICSVLLLD